MRVSIITAVCNAEETILRTLRSVENQHYPEIEHVVIDGQSTDRTVDIIRAKGRGVATLVSEPDSGVYDAFNKGLKHSTGDLVGFLNAGDEYIGPEVIRTVVAELSARRKGVIFGDLLVVDPADLSRVVRHYKSSLFRPTTFRYGFMPAHPTLFIRRELYERFGAYDVSYRIAGDFELIARLLVRHQVGYHYHPEVLVRMPRGGLSSNGWRANWLITKEMYRACVQNDINTSYLRLLSRLVVKLAGLKPGYFP